MGACIVQAAALCLILVLLHCTLEANAGWELATATWYGSPSGAGTDGGACGYGQLPGTPYGSDVAAGSPALFKNGKGCGECYLLKCFEQQLCSNTPVLVTVTDECPGGYCSSGNVHFDLSGTAFGKLASSGMTSQLLGSGLIKVLYTRVDCDYGQSIAFQVNQGSSPFWFSVLVRYEDGPGDLAAVELMEAGSSNWRPMNQIWGANWCLNSAQAMQAPFSFRLTSLTKQTVVAMNVIPGDWSTGVTYRSRINFQAYGHSYPDYADGYGGAASSKKGAYSHGFAFFFVISLWAIIMVN